MLSTKTHPCVLHFLVFTEEGNKLFLYEFVSARTSNSQYEGPLLGSKLTKAQQNPFGLCKSKSCWRIQHRLHFPISPGEGSRSPGKGLQLPNAESGTASSRTWSQQQSLALCRNPSPPAVTAACGQLKGSLGERKLQTA